MNAPLTGATRIGGVVVLVVAMTDERVGFETSPGPDNQVTRLGNHMNGTGKVHRRVLVVSSMPDLGIGDRTGSSEKFDITEGRNPDISAEVAVARMTAVANAR